LPRGPTAGNERFGEEAHLADRAQERRFEERPNACRDCQRHAARHEFEASVMGDEHVPRRFSGRHEFAREPELPAELDGFRLRAEKRVRAGVDEEALEPLRGDVPTEPLARLEQVKLHVRAFAVNGVSGGEARHSAADDDHRRPTGGAGFAHGRCERAHPAFRPLVFSAGLRSWTMSVTYFTASGGVSGRIRGPD